VSNYWKDSEGVWRYVVDDEPVPGAVETDQGMLAPELHPSALIDTDGIAKMIVSEKHPDGILPATIYTYRSRGEVNFPEPLTHFGQTPVWSRAVIEHWLASRPGRGGRPRAEKGASM
jgi:hypothetical protein